MVNKGVVMLNRIARAILLCLMCARFAVADVALDNGLRQSERGAAKHTHKTNPSKDFSLLRARRGPFLAARVPQSIGRTFPSNRQPASQSSGACPDSCRCSRGGNLRCVFQVLEQVPRNLPSDLVKINLAYNKLKVLPPQAFAASNATLRLLLLQSNEIHTIRGPALRPLSKLQELRLSWNQIAAIFKLSLRGLSDLTRLHLDHNKIKFIHPEAFRGLTNLKHLQLEGNKLSQLHSDTFFTLRFGKYFSFSHIQFLYLANNEFRVLPHSVLTRLASLRQVYLHENPWECSCHLQWLHQWMRESGKYRCKGSVFGQAEDPVCAVCASPEHFKNHDVIRVPFNNLTCSPPTPTSKHIGALTQVFPDEPTSLELAHEQLLFRVGREEKVHMTLRLDSRSASLVLMSCTASRRPRTFVRVDLDGNSSYVGSFEVPMDCTVEYPEDGDRLSDILQPYLHSPLNLTSTAKSPHLLKEHTNFKVKVHGEPQLEPLASIGSGLRVVAASLLESSSVLKNPSSTITITGNNFYPEESKLSLLLQTTVAYEASSQERRSADQPWTMLIHPESTRVEAVVALQGRTAVLKCKAMGYPKPSLSWVVPQGGVVRFRRSAGRVRVTRGGRLVIYRATSRDAGIYRCLSQSRDRRGEVAEDVASVRLHVVEPVETDRPTQRASAMIGDEWKLSCPVDAVPAARFAWKTPNQQLLKDDATSLDGQVTFKNGTILIKQVEPSHAGQYSCLAINRMGITHLPTYLNVTEGEEEVEEAEIDADESLDWYYDLESVEVEDDDGAGSIGSARPMEAEASTPLSEIQPKLTPQNNVELSEEANSTISEINDIVESSVVEPSEDITDPAFDRPPQEKEEPTTSDPKHDPITHTDPSENTRAQDFSTSTSVSTLIQSLTSSPSVIGASSSDVIKQTTRDAANSTAQQAGVTMANSERTTIIPTIPNSVELLTTAVTNSQADDEATTAQTDTKGLQVIYTDMQEKNKTQPAQDGMLDVVVATRPRTRSHLSDQTTKTQPAQDGMLDVVVATRPRTRSHLSDQTTPFVENFDQVEQITASTTASSQGGDEQARGEQVNDASSLNKGLDTLEEAPTAAQNASTATTVDDVIVKDEPELQGSLNIVASTTSSENPPNRESDDFVTSQVNESDAESSSNLNDIDSSFTAIVEPPIVAVTTTNDSDVTVDNTKIVQEVPTGSESIDAKVPEKPEEGLFATSGGTGGKYLDLPEIDGADDELEQKRLKETRQYVQKMIRANYGDSLTISCPTEGKLVGEINWTFQNMSDLSYVDEQNSDLLSSIVQEVNNTRLVVIDKLNKRHNGVYACHTSTDEYNLIYNMRLSVHTEAPKFVNMHTNRKLFINYGDSTSLSCNAEGIPAPEVSWSWPRSEILTSNSNLNSSVYTSPDNVLHISNAIPKFGVMFLCTASNVVGKLMKEIDITVMSSAPQIATNLAKSYSVAAGAAVLLDCRGSGQPTPTYSWTSPSGDVASYDVERVGKKVHQNGSLSLYDVTAQDAGTYRCTARNPIGDSSLAVKLQVEELDEETDEDLIDVDPDVTDIDNGPTSKPTTTSFAPNPIYARTHRYNLRVMHEGIAIMDCRTRFPSSRTTSSRFSRYYSRNRITVEWRTPSGEKVAFPSPTPSWRHRALYNNTLRIRKVEMADNGVYTCTATDKSGRMIRTEVTLYVEARPPIIRQRPHETIVTRKDRAASAHCSLTHKSPRARVDWTTPDGRIYTPGSWGNTLYVRRDGQLVLRSMSLSMVGKYLCAARNIAANVTRVVSFQMQAMAPKIRSHRFEYKYVRIGHSVRLTCSAVGVPAPAVYWTTPRGTKVTKNYVVKRRGSDQPKLVLLNSGTLVLNRAEFIDSGYYRCNARNFLGAARKNVKLQVYR